MNNLTLDDLRLFCAVARRSSFAQAAADLSVSAAQVSKRVAILEGQLGAKLFHRTTRRVAITDLGEQIFDKAQRLLEEADEIQELAAVRQRAPTGKLRISANFRLGRNHVAPIVSKMAIAYPELEIWLELVDRPVDLYSESFDVDIRIGKVPEPYLIGHRVAESSRVLCAAPSYLATYGTPKSLAELTQHRCLAQRERDQVFGVWRLEGPNGEESVKVTGRLSSNDSDAVRRWGLDGLGIMLRTEYDIAPSIAAGELVRVLPQYRQPADVWAVTTARLAQSAKIRVCVEFFREHLAHGPFALLAEEGQPAKG